ncbi:LysM peptidoglycan-binding domain-containing protein [Ahrensia sp. R2A130]|uniref:LysM peptidoglycan-binding domain-containing protein n=1 Tax=Ahrensia sp. R2A130 TaxID=744979 RepID=UPI0001E09C2A|nr:LysM peptidoglycan-binding domain-containing protein [Ahrensia sp. R2A130]EFL90633.1 peptidoglycan-binding LysM [Ahrensia sp. R2A130]
MLGFLGNFAAWVPAAGVATASAALVAGYVVVNDIDLFSQDVSPAPIALANTDQAKADLKPAVKVPEITKSALGPKPPSFDILRVEKDGSILIAGRAPANASVELIDQNGEVIATTKASNAGEFVILPGAELSPGDYTFSLRATLEGSASIVSAQGGVVRIPDRNSTNKDGVLAMIVEGGLPSRIVAKPFAEEVEVASIAPAKGVATDAVPPAQEEPNVEPAPTEATNDAVLLPPKPVVEEAVAQQVAPVAAKNPTAVSVEAVEVENDTVFIAGAVKRGKSVRVYINNEEVGTARGTQDDRFLVKKEFPLAAGSHSVRADVLDATSGEVTGRAEVPLVHEPLNDSADVASVTPVASPPAQAASPTYTVPIRTGSAIIIKPGDNLWRISRRNYGQGVRYTTIYEANREQIRNPNRIYIGQIFKLPHRAEQ